MNPKNILCECKFRNELFDISTFNALKKKNDLKGKVYYYLFSLSGFTDAVKQLAEISDNVRLIGLDELFN